MVEGGWWWFRGCSVDEQNKKGKRERMDERSKHFTASRIRFDENERKKVTVVD